MNKEDKSYFSFLICNRKNKSDIYINGIHIGDIVGKKFLPRMVENVKGEIVPYDLKNIPDYENVCPIKNYDELRRYIEKLFFVINDYYYESIEKNNEKERQEKLATKNLVNL